MKLPDRRRCWTKCHPEMWKLATHTPPVVLVDPFKHRLCKCAISGVSPCTVTWEKVESLRYVSSQSERSLDLFEHLAVECVLVENR
jgi:hypothetical protein